MENEYIIVNKAAIQKRIEELEDLRKNTSSDNNDYYQGQIKSLKETLSKSTPLIPEIEKAYFEGECYGIGTDAYIKKEDYITNLKLDI